MSDQAKAACCDGEDFELLAAVAAEHWPALQLAWPFAAGLATVGWLIDQPGAFREDHHGRVRPRRHLFILSGSECYSLALGLYHD
jgi:thiamine monophosphate kinase